MRWRLARGLSAAVLAAAAACVGSDPDPVPFGPSLDGGPGSDAAVSDAVSDATSDTGAPLDATAFLDGGTEASASPCGTSQLVCDDFERDEAPPGLWTTDVTDGGGLELTTAGGSRALRVTASPLARAWLSRHVAVPGAIRCELDLSPEAAGGDSTIAVVFDLTNAAGEFLRLDLVLSGTGLATVNELRFLADGGSTVTPGSAHLLEARSHLRIELGTGRHGRFRAFLDDVAIHSGDGKESALQDSTSFAITIGASSYATPQEWRLLYDNVVCDSASP